MYRFITETFHRLIESLPEFKPRYLYPSFNLQNKLTGLIGPRGVGKTTLMLQFIKCRPQEFKKNFYFSADLVYFQQVSLLEFVKDLHLVEGYQNIFIDEIHKYQNWNQELKNLYDSFPGLKIVFSGSSMLDLIHGSHDLSRRTKIYRLQGLSFREYLNFKQNLDLQPFELDKILQNPSSCLKQLSQVDRILPHFNDYLKMGYYPFAFEDANSYYEKISQVIDKTIFEDIANYFSLKTPNLHYFKKILTFFASIPPGELSINSLSKNLSLDHKTVEHYLNILTSVGLVRQLFPFENGGSFLRKPSKVVLNNTNLLNAIGKYLGKDPSKGMERELFFLQAWQTCPQELFYSKQGDYRTQSAIFEIGGKSKTNNQLKEVQEPAYLVKDDILTSIKGEIPLFLFGFLY